MMQIVTGNGITLKYVVSVTKTCTPAVKFSAILCGQSFLSSKGYCCFEKKKLKCIMETYTLKKEKFSPLKACISHLIKEFTEPQISVDFFPYGRI